MYAKWFHLENIHDIATRDEQMSVSQEAGMREPEEVGVAIK